MGKRQAQSEPTRKEILISRREREQLRVIYLGLGIALALVVIVLLIGAVQTYIIEPNSPVASVDGQEITTGEYQTRVHYERFLLDEQYFQILAQRASANQSGDEQLAQFLQSQYEQLLNQILQRRTVIDREVVDILINNRLVAADAAKRGITVSEDEVNEFINRFLARRQGGLTAAAANETVTARVDASATAALWTPTPTFTPSPTLTTTGSITPTATPVDTPTPAPTPTLTVIDTATLGTEYTNWLEILADNPGLNESEYREIIRTQVLEEKIREVLGAEVSPEGEQSNARHILVESEEEANDVIERLAADEDFAELATELSIDTSSGINGGDLGFVSKGTFVPSVDEAIFSLPIGEISEPVESDFGWHVIEVLAREVRELSPIEYQRSQGLAFDDWLTGARAAVEVEDFWTPEKAPPDTTNPLLQNQPVAPIAPHGG